MSKTSHEGLINASTEWIEIKWHEIIITTISVFIVFVVMIISVNEKIGDPDVNLVSHRVVVSGI